MTSFTFSLTFNNPTFSLESIYNSEEHECLAGQLEKGDSGTPHF